VSDVLLRPAVCGDVPQLIEICRRGWLSAFAQTVPFELIRYWVERDWYASHCSHYWRRMTVAHRDRSVIGVMEPLGDEINGLWLLPSALGRGIGTRLTDIGEAQIRAAGHRIAWVSCAACNEGAPGFCRRRGYVERRRYVHRIDAIGLDEPMIELERRLVEA
jgi:ribosomal protein S18 acetylase RimI-like enzyme